MGKDKERLIGIALISPSIIAVAVFIYGFILWSGRVSVSKWKGLLPDYTFIGVKNYLDLFKDPRFQIDIRNTVIFTVLFVGGALLLGLILAVLLDQDLPGEGFFRSLFI